MKLSLTDASALLDKTPRQVRYLIGQGQLGAQKVNGRWVIDSESLPLSEHQILARRRKAEQLRDTVEAALGPHTRSARLKYSVRQLAAFSAGTPIYHSLVAALGEPHQAAISIQQCLISISQGCHRYHEADKLEAYRQSREQASRAVALLLLIAEPDMPALAEEIETELIPAISGLIRRCERKRRR
jgi:hypothetical protein